MDRLGGPGCMGSRSIGLDIDRGALKAVQVSRSADAYTLRHIGYHRLPPGAIAEGEVADADLLATEIREFWSSHSFKGKSVILGVAHARVVVRLLDFLRMEEEGLESALAPANPDTDGDSILDNRDEEARAGGGGESGGRGGTSDGRGAGRGGGDRGSANGPLPHSGGVGPLPRGARSTR